MKMKNIYAALAFTASLLLGACSDNNNDNHIGPQLPEDNPGVYFPLAESYYYEFSGDDIREIPVTVARTKTKGELTVPLSIKAPDANLTIPASAVFADGQAQVSFTVDCSGLPAKQLCQFSVSVPDGYSTPYGQGSETYEAKVLVLGNWEPIATDVTYKFEDYDFVEIYGDATGELLTLEGTGRYKLTNFLGSGLDINFSIGKKVGSNYDFVPLNNYISYEEYYGSPSDFGCWYFYDSENDKWPTWSPDGSENKISYPLMYGYEEASNYLWSYISLAKGSANFVFQCDFSDGTNDYVYVKVKFTPVTNQ